MTSLVDVNFIRCFFMPHLNNAESSASSRSPRSDISPTHGTLPIVDDDVMICQFARHAEILLNQQHCTSCCASLRIALIKCSIITGASPSLGSSINSKRLSGIKRARNRQHLLLPTGEAATCQAEIEPLEIRETARSMKSALRCEDRHLLRSAICKFSSHAQIFEDGAMLRHVTDTHLRDMYRGACQPAIFPSNVNRATRVGGVMPMILLSVVVLPAPLRPRQNSDAALSGTLDAHAFQNVKLPDDTYEYHELLK